MAKARTTLTIDEDVLRAVKLRAARTGQGESQVIEDAVRTALDLDVFEQIWDAQASLPALDEDAAMALALEAQASVRGRG
ncbi:MAG TPA: ribbon-helix-helix protein, CopG family, partial [Baekduia sp.]|nr:ribbon-helix-helix protein, CopG family [Baekduia sp.]